MAATLILQKECEAAGLNWVFGYSLTFTDGINKIDAKIYCQTQDGLQNLLRIQKSINVDSDNKIIDLQDLLKYGPGNVIVFSKYASAWLKEIGDNIDRFLNSFDDCFYQLDLAEFKAERIDIKVLEATKCYFDNLYNTGDLPPVLISDCYYLDKDDAKIKSYLTRLQKGRRTNKAMTNISKIWMNTGKPYPLYLMQRNGILKTSLTGRVKIQSKLRKELRHDTK